VYNPRKQILMTLILTFIIIYIFAMYQFFFLNDGKDLADDGNGASLANNVKFLIHKGLPQGTAEDFMEGTISTFRIFYDLLFFVCILLVLNILKGECYCCHCCHCHCCHCFPASTPAPAAAATTQTSLISCALTPPPQVSPSTPLWNCARS
jgi:hypothetical protein